MVRLQGGQLALDLGQFRGAARHAGVVLARAVDELVAPRGEVGEAGGQLGENLFGRRQFAVGFRHLGVDAGTAAGILARLGADGFFLGRDAGDGGFGVGCQPQFALAVGGELHQPLVELGQPIARALFLAVEIGKRDIEAVQRGAGARFRFAQLGQAGCGRSLPLGGFRFRRGALGHDQHALVLGLGGGGDFGSRGGVAQVIERGFRLAHLRRHVAVAHGLARLLLQRFHLRGQLADHILGAREIGFRRLQAQFGLVPARMQAGDAGGFFQHAAALLGLGLDDLADAALMHERGRARAGRGVGEQDLHVAGAHFAAVDAVIGAGIAFDAASDFQQVGVVEGGGRGALHIVDRDRHFGIVARRARIVAGEDDVVHRRRAHGLVRAFAHHPAQRFDQIGLAAAVRTDHAGEARFDQEVGGFDERLEAEKAQPCELHTFRSRLPAPDGA